MNTRIFFFQIALVITLSPINIYLTARKVIVIIVTYIVVSQKQKKTYSSLVDLMLYIIVRIYDIYKKKVGVLPVRIVWSNVSSVGPSSERNRK